MRFYSTNKKSSSVIFKDALLSGLASDGGLYMPETFSKLNEDFFEKLGRKSFTDIALTILQKFITDIPKNDLEKIIMSAYAPRAFSVSRGAPAPLIKLDHGFYILELFHGPTLSFKDFGARFMSRVMNYYLSRENKKLNIIVATSGDTGSAVAHGFYGTSHIKVFVLYPSGRVSELQEKQMATLGKNIIALEVQGDFDDCQRLAKMALRDGELRQKMNISSANSINIGRLLPQMLYYFWAYKQLPLLWRVNDKTQPRVIVPSGNFGNLTAGLFAKKLGLPIAKFIAAVNVNSGVPEYLQTGDLPERKTEQTISNAMDVGRPSNFSRILDLYDHNRADIRKDIDAFTVTDQETREAMKQVYQKYEYISDPHTGAGLAAANQETWQGLNIILSTAHPAKFKETVEEVIEKKIPLPAALRACARNKTKSIIISPHYSEVRDIVLRFGSRD